MGYSSEVVIAVRKEILAEDLIHPVIPKSLRDLGYLLEDGIVYWHIDSWKWYGSYPEIQEIEAFFALLSDREPLEVGDQRFAWFGAMRMGENDDDIQTWGEPYDFEITSVRYIDFPGRT